MSAGTPIVCSQVASIPEVAGDAALYVDPGRPAALAAAVLRLLDDDVLRKRLVSAGYERVRRFSFAETRSRSTSTPGSSSSTAPPWRNSNIECRQGLAASRA